MSHTACPHCGSTNSIETAGQRYCADCGQLIHTKNDDKKADKKEEQKEETKQSVNKSIHKAVVHKAPAAKPRKIAPPLNLKVIEESRNPKTVVADGPGVLNLKDATPQAIIKKTVGRHVLPAKPVNVRHQAVPMVSEAPIAEVRVPAPSKKFHHKLALRDALKAIVTGKNFGNALAATSIAVLCQLIFLAVFASTGAYAISESMAAGSINAARLTTLVGHSAWAILLSFAGYLVYHYAMAKIILRTSSTLDGRRTNTAQLRRSSLGSLAAIVVVDIVSWLLALGTIAMIVGANVGFLGTKSLGMVGVVLAILVNIIAVYFWLGLVIARIMASYAIVLGQVGVGRAYSTGWSLYNREFGRLTSGLLIILLVSIIIALPATLLLNTLGISAGLTIRIVAAAAALTQAVILVLASVYFLRLYRFLIAREYDSELGQLLSGRQPRASHVGRRLAVLGAIILVVVASMTSLIIYASPVAAAFIR